MPDNSPVLQTEGLLLAAKRWKAFTERKDFSCIDKVVTDSMLLANFAASLLDKTPASVEWLEANGVTKETSLYYCNLDDPSVRPSLWMRDGDDKEPMLLTVTPTCGQVLSYLLAEGGDQ